MLLKCFLIFGLVLYIEAASISKEIPVNVVYVQPEETLENAREKTHVRYLQNRNLDEKIQLSSRELKEANLHLPVQDEPSQEKPDEKVLTKAKAVFLEKLTTFREQVDGFKLKSDQKKPTAEDWSILNAKLQEVFKKYEGNGLRQNQGGFVQELMQATGQWIQSFGGNNNNPTGQEDEQPVNQGGLGQVWTNFQNSVSQAFSNLANNNNNQESTTSNTVLGDTGVSTPTKAPGIIQSFVSSVFNNNNNQGNKPPGQEDTGNSQPPNLLQGAFNNLINTFNPSTEKPANAQGDTGESSSTTSAPGNQFFQNLGAAFGTVFGQNTKPPGVAGDNEVSKPPGFFQNVGQVFQTVFNQNNNENQATSTVGIQYPDGTTAAPNPLQQGIQQIQQTFQGQNPGQQNFASQAQNIGQQLTGGNGNNQLQQQLNEVIQNPPNFASQAQNIGQQLSGNLPSGSQNPGQQLSEAFQNQNFASQAQNIGQQLSGNLPSGSQNPGQQLSEAIQNPSFATQAQNIGQQLSGNGNPASNFQSSVSNLNINQVPVIGQQLSQNTQNPLQNLGEQFQGNNVLNQIQSSTNQIQNPVVVSNKPVTSVDNQNTQLNINQLTQVIPTNSQAANDLQSTLTNQFTNGVSQLNPQTASSNFVSAVNNPLEAASEYLQNNRPSNEQKPDQSFVNHVPEEKGKVASEKVVSEKEKVVGEKEKVVSEKEKLVSEKEKVVSEKVKDEGKAEIFIAKE